MFVGGVFKGRVFSGSGIGNIMKVPGEEFRKETGLDDPSYFELVVYKGIPCEVRDRDVVADIYTIRRVGGLAAFWARVAHYYRRLFR